MKRVPGYIQNVPPKLCLELRNFKTIPEELCTRTAEVVKAFLQDSRQNLQNLGHDPNEVPFDVNCPYFAQAYGFMFALMAQGYGYFGPSNQSGVDQGRTSQPHQNLRWWLYEMENEVLASTGFVLPSVHSVPQTTIKIFSEVLYHGQ